MNSRPENTDETPLQAAISRALAAAPQARDHYDKIVQAELGTTGKPIYDIQRGKSKKPSVDTLQAIARALSVPVETFTNLSRKPARIVLSDLPPTRSITADIGPAKIRQLDLSFAMGPGTNIDDYVEEAILDFDTSLLRSLTRTPEERLFAARGDGDSMFPTLLNGDMVLVDTLQRTLNLHDRIWAISLFGAGAIKRLRPIGNGQIEVISDNPTIKPQTVDASDLSIMGRVIWVGRRV